MTSVARGFWLSLLLLCLGLLLLWQTLGLGPTARFVPQYVIGPTLLLLLIQLTLDLSPKLQGGVSSFARFQTTRADQLRERTMSVEDRPQPGPLGRDVCWYVLAPALIYILGFTLAAPLYTFVFLRLRAEEPLRRCVPTALLVGIAVFGFFNLVPSAPTGTSQFLAWLMR
jgi:hypothetical protein